MKRLTFLYAALLAAAGSTALAQEPLRIGQITTLSGPGGYIGQDIRDAFSSPSTSKAASSAACRCSSLPRTTASSPARASRSPTA
jgi:hypothetical protein